MQKLPQNNEPFCVDTKKQCISKQKYLSPQIVKYGSVAKLTAGASGPTPDGTSGKSRP